MVGDSQPVNLWCPKSCSIMLHCLLDPVCMMALCGGACFALSLSTTPLGDFPLMRRMSLVDDALSDAILPGIAIGYLLSGLSLIAMGAGGLIASLVVAMLSVRVIAR